MTRNDLIYIVRAELACQSSGRAGLCALQAPPALPPLQTAAYERFIASWLRREMNGYDPQISAQGSRFTLSFSQGPKLQLRFVPRYCRWILMVKRGRFWWPHVPARGKRCLALCDWLGQVRQIVTGRTALTVPAPRDIAVRSRQSLPPMPRDAAPAAD